MTASSLIIHDARDQEIADLKAEIESLRRDLTTALRDGDNARNEAIVAVRALQAMRRQLSPLYKALQMVFGELDVAGIDDTAPAPSPTAAPNVDARVSAVWQSWKNRLGGTVAKGIDALLVHGELDTQQLAIAAGLDKRTITNTVVYKLNQAGLINKNGGKFSLKAL